MRTKLVRHTVNSLCKISFHELQRILLSREDALLYHHLELRKGFRFSLHQFRSSKTDMQQDLISSMGVIAWESPTATGMEPLQGVVASVTLDAILLT